MLLHHLASLEMNTYLYAPKEDPFHRIQWRESYPQIWRRELTEFITKGKQRGITVIPAMAPGLSYDYRSQKDYQTLVTKFKELLSCGATTIALLMDDIPEELPKNCKTHFSSLGQAHALLLQKLFKDLSVEQRDLTLWFCPTVYTDQFAKVPINESVYLQELATDTPKSIKIMWTGPRIIAESLTVKNLAPITQLFKERLIIWDNLYANDYAPLRLFVGPYAKRNPKILDKTSGLLINPTGLLHTDTFLLSLFADFIASKSATKKQWLNIAQQFGIPKEFIAISRFFWSPFTENTQKDFPQTLQKNPQKLFDDLVVAWQSPLKNEWYPFLQSFWQDLFCLTKKGAAQRKWQSTHYPSALALRLDKAWK